MSTRMEIVRYKIDRTDRMKSGWQLEGGHLGASRDCPTVLANAVALLSKEGMVLQIVRIPSNEFQDISDFGILVESR